MVCVHIVRVWLVFLRTTCCLGFCPVYTFNDFFLILYSKQEYQLSRSLSEYGKQDINLFFIYENNSSYFSVSHLVFHSGHDVCRSLGNGPQYTTTSGQYGNNNEIVDRGPAFLSFLSHLLTTCSPAFLSFPSHLPSAFFLTFSSRVVLSFSSHDLLLLLFASHVFLLPLSSFHICSCSPVVLSTCSHALLSFLSYLLLSTFFSS
jgi:hypothetical protein